MKKKKLPPMKFCPECGSPNVDWLLPQIWSKWKCKDCGYIGPLIIENGKIAKKIREEYLKKYGKE
jgi:transposase-like protein